MDESSKGGRAAVAVAARNEDQVVGIAAEIREQGGEAYAFRCDVAEERQVRDLVLSAIEAMGHVDILVNNAGTATSNPLTRITLAEWRHIMDVNATTVAETMSHRGVERLIHGHTHRPARHALSVGERIVLGDWNDTGWCLRERDDTLSLEQFSL